MRYVTHVKRYSPRAVIAGKSGTESGVLFCAKTAVAQRTSAESRFKKVRIFSPTIMFLLIQQSDSRYSAAAMKFRLDYDKMHFLDAEDLAEAGIREAYQAMMRALGQYVSEPAEVQEVIDNKAPSYVVKCAGLEYVIYSPALPEVEGRSWGRAAHAFFKIVNDQLAKSEYLVSGELIR